MSQSDIHYSVSAVDPAAHLFEVTVEVARPDPAGQRFFMPAWIPGSYLIRDFGRHVVRFTAESDGEPVAVGKSDKSTWKCAPCDGPLRATYRVFAHDLSVRGAHLDRTHGYFNGACLFVAVVGRERDPVSVDITRPAIDAAKSWRVATTLAADDDDWEFGRYRANDYEDLIDHPVEMGEFEVVDFEAADTPHAVVLCGRHRVSAERLRVDLARVCEQHAALFGGLPDMARYLFLVRVLDKGYGGLEHRSSSSLMCRRDELPRDESGMNKDYRRFLGLASHEYFHLWNVKRIKPAVFTPYYLDTESHTELLWVFEGITSYYDDLALVRSGVIDEKNYLELLATGIGRVLATPGRFEQSLAAASFDAWTKFYKPTANTPNAAISYYGKGALVALALDLTIRERTNGEKSLDHCMRAMWEMYGKPGIGVPEDGFEKLADEVTGLQLKSFFDTYIRGVEDPDLARLFSNVGVKLERCRRHADVPVTLGIKLDGKSGRLASVYRGGPAETAGLAPGDQIVAIDGLKFDPGQMKSVLHDMRPGDRITVHAFRRDELLDVEIALEEDPLNRCKLSIDKDASARQKARRRAWVGPQEAIDLTR